MKTIHFKTKVNINSYEMSFLKYLNIDLVEAEFIEMVFQLLLLEPFKVWYETKEELTFEKAFIKAKQMMKNDDYYEIITKDK